MNDKLLSLMGLCRRAGKLTIGAKPVIESLCEGKAKLVIFASDFSDGSAKPVKAALEKSGVNSIVINRNKNALSLAVGKLCGVAAVVDEGFARKLSELNDRELRGELYG